MSASGLTRIEPPIHEQTAVSSLPAVVLDTNVFVAAGFNRRSSSARILERIREHQLRMVWNEHTQRETRYILEKIPPLAWDDVADLFRPEERFAASLDRTPFSAITDPDDRKFAALAVASEAVLVTADDHLLSQRHDPRVEILTPSEYWHRHEGSD